MGEADQTASVIWYVVAFGIVAASLFARRLPIGAVLRMALLWVVIFAALLGLFKLAESNGLLSGRLAEQGALVPSEGAPPPSMPPAQTQGQTLRIPVSPDGHYWVEGTINGQPARFLIDSGATITALSDKTAQQMGLSFDLNRPGVIMTTANGKVEARRSSIATLALGPIRASDIDVVVSPAFGEMNVIGMNMLSRLKSWSVQNGEMVLTP